MAADTTLLYLIDPDTDFLAWAAAHLRAPDVVVQTFGKADEALAAFQKKPADLVLCEVRLPGTTGIEVLKRMRLLQPNCMVILTSAMASTSHVIEAMRMGAYDFMAKDKLPYELRPLVESALRASEARKVTLASASTASQDSLQETIIGRSSPMQEVFKLIGRVSRADAPVMVTGESGCGKELVARAIHKFSPRVQKEFVAINVTAIPDSLLESELFGHEKGSFTGAVNQRMGRFEQCDGGTLFLDEIGDMPLNVQSKLLRVLQEGEFSRVGGNQTLKTDVRVLAATNRNLETEVEAGKFREDLFYRLNVVRIHIPPLRERRDDVRLLAEFFLQRQSARKRGPQMRFSEDALAMLSVYDWPGNVRELENTIQRACALSNSDVLLPADIPLGNSRPSAGHAVSSLNRMRDALAMLVSAAEGIDDGGLMPWVERELSRLVLRQCEDDVERATAILGVRPATSAEPDRKAKSRGKSAAGAA
jgi:two-component system, NtrC family, nitrogen regulation response regulator GlnG